MATASVNGTNLYYEITGKGFPLVLCHEFAGNLRSWDLQVKYFSRRYQVVTYSARGYPPSDVPVETTAYSPEIAIEDLHQLLRHLGIKKGYIGGLSMGGNVALNFCIAHPEMARALIVAGTGAGTTDRKKWEQKLDERDRRLEVEGWKAVGEWYFGPEPWRKTLKRKDPKGWNEFLEILSQHSTLGSILVSRNVILPRPTIFSLESKLRQLPVPTLIMLGDEDERCIEPALFMKRNIPNAGLVILPKSGHVINLEEPELFNRVVLDFLTSVEAESFV